MKIVQIINGLQIGGAEKLVMDLHQGYLSRGNDSIIVSLTGTDNGWSGKGLYSLGLSSPYDFRALPRLLSGIEETEMNNADVIHSHLFPAQLYTAVLKEISQLSCHFVTTEHGTLNRRRGSITGRIIDRWQYSCYDRIFCVSHGAGEELGNWIPELVNRIEIIYNGIDNRRFGDNRIFRSEPPFTILSIGSLRDKKNYTTAIKAFAILRNRVSPGVRFRIAGEGILMSTLEQQVKELGLESDIEFLGNVEDIAQLLHSSDVFFMPSCSEAFGLAAVEAMASGLPVVVSDIPGITEVVGENDCCGMLVSPASPDQMADALQYLIENRDRAYAMGTEGLNRAAMFSIEGTVEEYLRAYEDILNEGSE